MSKKSVMVTKKPWQSIRLSENMEFLRDYQKEGVQFLQWNSGHALLADDMGIGKTCQAIAYLRCNPKRIPALIIVLAPTKLQWQKEIEKFFPAAKSTILYGRTPHPIDGDKIYIINWKILQYWEEELLRHPWKQIVADEIQVLANRQLPVEGEEQKKGKTIEAFLRIFKKVRRVVALSGTPITGYPRQFYTILHILRPDRFSSMWGYLKKYCGREYNGFGCTYNGATNMLELHNKLRGVMLRRKKEDVLTELPGKNRIMISLGVKKSREYTEFENQLLSGSVKKTEKSFDHLKWSAFEMKKKVVIDWIKDFIRTTDKKLCVFSWHREVLEYLHSHFRKSSVVYYGGTTAKNKQKAIQDFKGSKPLFFGNIKSAGVGVDGLQSVCSNMVVVEFTWNPGDHDQIEDRLYRMGQNDIVNIYYLIASGSVEEYIMGILDKKRRHISGILDGGLSGGNDLFSDLVRIYTRGKK